jgi:hypothetical protein
MAFRVDHIVVVVGDFLVHALGRVCQEIAMLANRAALHRHIAPHGGKRALKPGADIDDQRVARIARR